MVVDPSSVVASDMNFLHKWAFNYNCAHAALLLQWFNECNFILVIIIFKGNHRQEHIIVQYSNSAMLYRLILEMKNALNSNFRKK